MFSIQLSTFEDVRKAREWVGHMARAAGIRDPGAAVMAAGELANNCVEHGSECPGLLRIGCRQGRLSLQFENDCQQRPNWRTRKPVAVAAFRTGGYGLPIARALARTVNCRWKNGRVFVRAEFD
jgi:anti-sigma regulatory factor (Ser/Thr protein kinase)